MIRIANDKLFSLAEVLERVRDYTQQQHVTDVGSAWFDVAIKVLAIALDESEDFIRGAIKTGG